MPDKQYPSEKYGSETEVTLDTSTGNSVAERDEVYNGGVTRKLIITEDSIKVEDQKDIVQKIFDLYKKQQAGSILGFSVDATKYHPQNFKISRILVSTIALAK